MANNDDLYASQIGQSERRTKIHNRLIFGHWIEANQWPKERKSKFPLYFVYL